MKLTKIGKNLMAICTFLLLSTIITTSATALVIDFEDVSPGPLADGYKSLHWKDVTVGNSNSRFLSGNVGYGSNISIYSGPFSYFNLESMQIASDSTDTVWIRVKSFDELVMEKEINLDELEDALLYLDLLNITSIDLWTDDDSTFMIDNLKVSWLCGGGKCGTFETPETPVEPPCNPPCTPPRTDPPEPPGPPPPPPPPGPPPPNPPPPTPVPEPSTFLLTAAGLVALVRIMNRRR